MVTTPLPETFTQDNPLIRESTDWSPPKSMLKGMHPVPRPVRLVVNTIYDYTIGAVVNAWQRVVNTRRSKRWQKITNPHLKIVKSSD